jgi:hypothetical protein
MNKDLSFKTKSAEIGQARSQRKSEVVATPTPASNTSGMQLGFDSLLNPTSEFHTPTIPRASGVTGSQAVTQEQVDRILVDYPFIQGEVYKYPIGRPPVDPLGLLIYKRRIELHQLYLDSKQHKQRLAQSAKRTRTGKTNLPSDDNMSSSDQSTLDSSPEVNIAKSFKLTNDNIETSNVVISSTDKQTPEAIMRILTKLQKENETLKSQNVLKNTRLKELERSVTELKTRLDQIELNLQNRPISGSETRPKVKDWAAVVKEVDSGKKDTTQFLHAADIIDTSKHIEDMNKKRNRVIIFGTEMSGSTDPKTINNHDWNVVDKIFSHIGIDSRLVDNCFRLRTRATDRPVPLVLSLKPNTNKNNILAAARRLRYVRGYENIYIKPDLTLVEEQRERELRLIRDEYNNEETSRNLPFRSRIRRNDVYRTEIHDKIQYNVQSNEHHRKPIAQQQSHQDQQHKQNQQEHLYQPLYQPQPQQQPQKQPQQPQQHQHQQQPSQQQQHEQHQ